MAPRDAVTVYYLEMTSPDQLRPARTACPELALVRAEIPCPEFSRFLYEAVGGEWNWTSRRSWTLESWLWHLDRPELQTWVAYVSGTPAGFCELELEPKGNVELVQFGLLPSFIGHGLGGQLLTQVVQHLWQSGAARVWLHTCTDDHPHALDNYIARGFRLYRQESRPVPAASVRADQ